MSKQSVVDRDTLGLIASLTGQPEPDQSVPRSIVFTSALTAILLGTILADSAVALEEKQRLRDTIQRLTGDCSSTQEFAKAIFQGIKNQQSYKKLQHLVCLVQPLAIAERLLLIAFGYEMAAADGSMDDREARYLERVGQEIGLKPEWINVLKAAFCNISDPDLDPQTKEQVSQLLDPSRFQGLELSLIDAATYIHDRIYTNVSLETKTVAGRHDPQNNIQYQGFIAFQSARTELLNILEQIQEIVVEFIDKSFLNTQLLEDLTRIHDDLKGSEFRIAIVGEFSKGKSTLLNALLGEPIQPVRAIPCSGAISMIRHADPAEITCYYTDGREELLLPDEYQERVSIPRSEARGDNLGNALLEASQIEKVVFGSPHLNLCQQGVVIIDSPGLNEHPKRTEITQKILEKIDAAIVLSHAQNLLSQSEFQILEDLRKQLNLGDESRPAESLFFIVNFMDLLEDEADREDAKERAEKKLLKPFDGKGPILASPDRLHYLSAGKALKAIQRNSNDEYLQSLENFVTTLENFLTRESGSIRLNAAQARAERFYDMILSEIDSLHNSLSGEIFSIQDEVKQQFLEEVGDIGGRLALFKEQVKQQCKATVDQYRISVERWETGLAERLKIASSHWTDRHSSLWERDQKIKDYISQLESDFSKDLERWCEETLIPEIMDPALGEIEQASQKIMQEMDKGLARLGEEVLSPKARQVFCLNDLGISDIDREMGAWGVGGAVGMGAGVLIAGAVGAAVLIPGIAIAPIVAAVVGLVGGGGLLGSGFGVLSKLDEGIREAVFKEGLISISREVPNLIQQLENAIRGRFEDKITAISKRSEYYILKLNLELKRNQKIADASVAERQADLAWLESQKDQLIELRVALAGLSHKLAS
ncbi:MAG: dynamin family protein [Cyanobacteria bacterium]|nr:dynamin family protein [Cyanobacteriota bacterium]